jgi:hypothetical protein
MRAALTVVATLLSGCATHYVYTPPSGPTGQACIASCADSHTMCEEGVKSFAEAEQRRCERSHRLEQQRCELEAEAEYHACTASQSDVSRPACIRRSCNQWSCVNALNYDECDDKYNACYRHCGGKVDDN